MSHPSPKARFSFQAKMLVPVLTLLAVVMLVVIGLVSRRITRQVECAAVQQLDLANTVFTNTRAIRLEALTARYRGVIAEPSFKATISLFDRASIVHLLNEIVAGDDDAQVAIFTSEGGESFASTNHPANLNVAEFQARSAESLRRALNGHPNADIVRVGDSMFQVISLPCYQGVMSFGVELGGDIMREVRKLHGEIFFISDGTILGRPDLDPAFAGKFVELLTVAERSSRSAKARPNEIRLGGERYACRVERFATLSKESRESQPGYVIFVSLEEPLGLVRAARGELLWVGLGALLVGAVVVSLTVHKLTRPLRRLRDSAEAVGSGDLSQHIEVDSQDECGELAEVFNRMTGNLQASRAELERTVETLKATQHQLIQSEKLVGIGEFVSGVAHELNNPLTSVMGFAELLQQAELPESQRRLLDMISKSAKRCQKIVQSLLSFARRHAPERKVVSVNEVLESAVEILHYQMRTSNIEVITQLDPALPSTLVDPHQMQQVFLNIINNARQAIEGHQSSGRLSITTAAINGRVRITFEDNGPGIAPENLDKIFNPFFTTKEVGKGTGLGLSLCYGIVSEHGGLITPYSKPGQGATFVIELPITREAAALKKATVPLQLPDVREGAGRRVLVIDDEDSILQMMQEALTLSGYKVDIVRDGETALRRLKQYQYDLALCDWKMPGLNGQQVYEQLQATNPDMSRRLIFITGDVVNEKTREFLKETDKICLSKPFTLSEFRAAIGRLLSPVKG